MSGPGHWITLDSLVFLNKLYLSVGDDEPLGFVLRRIFTGILGKLMFYSRCDRGLHLMIDAKDPARIKITHLLLAGQPSSISKSIGTTNDPARFPEYVQHEELSFGVSSEIRETFELLDRTKLYTPRIRPAREWKRLIGICKRSMYGECDDAGISPRGHPGNSQCDEELLSAFDLTAQEEILAIVFSEPDRKLPAGRLGIALMWGNSDMASMLDRLAIQIHNAVGYFCRHVDRFLATRHEVKKDTYLPNHRRSGYRSVAILFADIRNFTPMTEILRNFNLLEELRFFISTYCEDLCRVIQDNGGRVHSLAGDGIMALFGEECDDPQKAVKDAALAAEEMCNAFEGITRGFLRRKEMQRFLRNAYEPMDPRLGIGINFGQVLIDYFGVRGSRQYSPLGDHVNFAQRLESEAARYDERLVDAKSGKMGRMRAPILLSRPAWIVGGYSPQDKDSDLNIQVKGKPYAYPAYEWWPKGPPI
ncbi:MAG: adenylate/guanylate cyclase domain-containing protein [Deltaproteobacteria bacterium]|nr:adenylate/guanylate cyclase domain-containing protein [Deltaproteobacteria bacterium]